MTTVDPSTTTSKPTSSVGKALALLEAFDGVAAALGVTELARRAGVPKSTAFRLLAVLEENGYIERDDTRYRLSRKLFELGNLVPYCWPTSLRDVALPFLGELYARSRETVHLAVADRGDVLYLEKFYGHRTVSSPSRIGGRVPLHCTGLGKAMLAFAESTPEPTELVRYTSSTIVSSEELGAELERVTREGLAFDHEESRDGITCAAAPIVVQGIAIGAVSVCGPVDRFRAESAAPLVADTASRIERELASAGAAASIQT